MSFLYFKKIGDSSSIICLQNDAKSLAKTDMDTDMDRAQTQTDMDRNWLFVYEALDQQNLDGDWVAMKKQGVSFLKSEFRY